MSLLLLLNPQPLPPPTGLNPDVELDTFLVSRVFPEAYVEADNGVTVIAGNDPTARVLTDEFSTKIVAV